MKNIIGQSLGRYHILDQLGEGGMATVFKAYDTRLEREVAVKVIRTERLTLENTPKALKRFEREAKSLGKLTHPNIVPVSDYGEYEGKPYLVMPYLPGGTLKARLGKPMPWQEAVKILIPIANALEYAHEHNIIHRDIKPANILITEKGEPMLSDFGVAKLLDVEETMELTGTGVGLGTPEYMAPEQWTGQTSPRSDIYSLGIVMYEMLTGRKPYTADTPAAVLLKQANDPLQRPGKFVTNLPQKVENILLKALAKNPNDRYQTMGDLSNALEGLSSGKVVPAREKRKEVKLPTIPRKTVIAAVVGVIILVVMVILYKSLLSIPVKLPSSSTPAIMKTPQATATSEFNVGSTMTGNDGATLVFVPAGEFMMGSNDGNPDETPAHKVNLDAFWIDQTEVTNAMYAKCMDAGKCGFPNNADYLMDTNYSRHPVISVDWDQANAYCTWAGRELPSEAQWEKAARGKDAFTYPWGNITPGKSIKSLLNYNNNLGTTNEVGKYESGKSPYGTYDMAGNVFEWVNDWYDPYYYQNSPTLNPMGPNSGEYRVIRGGSWSSTDSKVRSAYRDRSNPTVTFNYGFRCSRSIP